ncbi:MAG: ribosome biogenesis GTPase Der [Phycisphaerae bacterium]
MAVTVYHGSIMALPVVAIVGRPNVGKSSLFNAITRRRTSIVEPTAGVTRDRVTTVCDIDDVYFELVDTGGHGIVDRDDLDEHVERQIRYAIDQAHLILFLVDVREGLTPLDEDTAKLLRPYSERVRLLVNKVDEPHMESGIGEFVRLGFSDPLAVSAVSGVGRTALRELIQEAVSGVSDEVPADPVMKIAIVGKRNTGKSTFINALAGEERVIVSEIPGTTRDSIDVRFEKDGRTLIAIDTAGVRKKSKIVDDIEFYAYSRVMRSIHRADVVLLLIDATVPVGQVDKRLARLVADEHKPCILVINKWDLAKGLASSEDFGEYLAKVLPEVVYAPIAFTSAVTGRNLDSTIDLATELFKQSRIRVGTGQLNQALKEALAANAPRPKRGRKMPKFFYATQVSTQPPTIVIFVNGPNLVTQNYERFLLNRFRGMLPFPEIPIRLMFRARRERK